MRRIISLFYIVLALSTANCLAAKSQTLHFMFGISELYSPVLSDKENKAVLDSLTKGAIVTATYRHTTREFRWFSTIDGVATIPDPGYKYTSTEDHREFSLTLEPDNRYIMGADIPTSLEGDYVLSGLYVQLSPDVFYQQPSYLSAIKNLSEKDLKSERELRSSPSFEYLVHLDNTKKENPIEEQQGCLFVSTPYGYPDTSIPVVTQVGTRLFNANFTYVMHQTCPLINAKNDEHSTLSPGHLPPARIAAAQANIDYVTTENITRKWGLLPVTKEMTRWYQRNTEGVYASWNKFGSFESFSIRVRWDTAYPEAKRLPIRTETWYFYNKDLVKYNGSIYYSPSDKAKSMSADETVYFYGGKNVYTESQQENCDAKGCQNALADIKQHSTQSHEELQQEAERYMLLPLIPAKDDD
ncbi:TPA: hypothetical protein ACUEMK_004744 [Escherichia coli]